MNAVSAILGQEGMCSLIILPAYFQLLIQNLQKAISYSMYKSVKLVYYMVIHTINIISIYSYLLMKQQQKSNLLLQKIMVK